MQLMESLDQYFFSPEESIGLQEHPWVCPQCQLRFKWDVQLLRHERQENHHNPNRLARRARKGRKEDCKGYFSCQYCAETFSKSFLLLNHKPWCLHDLANGHRVKLQLSSWNQRHFECFSHDFPCYFSSLSSLQRHMASHCIQASPKSFEKIELKRNTINQQIISKLKRQFLKYKRLKLCQVQRIAQDRKVSIATVRRYFRKFKRNDL